MNLNMFKEFILTDEEVKFLESTEKITSASTTGQTVRKVLIDLYSIKHAEKNTNALIDSNKKLAKSTDKHANAMRYLTGALVLIAAVQAIFAAIVFYINSQLI